MMYPEDIDPPETKPNLSLGYFPIQGGAVPPHMSMPSNSLQLGMGNGDSGHNSAHVEQNSRHHSENGTNLSALHMSHFGPGLELMGHSDDSSNASNNPIHMVGVGQKREFSLLGNFSRVKRRRDDESVNGISQQQQGRQAYHRSTPPMSPLHSSNGSQFNQNGHHLLHQNIPTSLHMSPSRSSSPQSPIHKPVPGFQGLQMQQQQHQQRNSFNASSPLQNLQLSSSPHASAFHEPGPVPDWATRRAAVRAWGNQPLSVADPDLWDIMEKEKQRQWKGIELIASENFVCQGVIEALGSHLTNKYSEGFPGARYYGGNEYIDQIESLCCQRALEAFHLEPEKWGVNVQPYSCTSANFAVYTALLQPKDRIMGLDSPSGGHLSHGYYTSSGKKVSGASIFFESFPYKVNPNTGYIDYEKLEEKALDFRPKILICGGSSYPREWDYGRFRQLADKCGAVLMCDMAHISGLVAAQECVSPFDYCDIVTSTTHKSLRGPRGGIIFYRRGLKPRKRGPSIYQSEDNGHYDFEERINFAVFPSLQGGPHNNHIAALAVAFKQVATPEYKSYIQQVKRNSQALASALLKRNCKLVTGGTDNHLLLWDLRPLGLTGNRYEKVCEMCHLTVNKNAVFGDSGAMSPGGVRIGTPAMTSRGCVEEDFEIIAEFLFKAAQIASIVLREHGKLQKDFLKGLQNNKEILELRASVEKFASQFEMPGFDVSTMKYNN
uniref:Serine hydroxymethyltransferase n=1 Tax=Wollemia nobilis TaxID=56998 RepID=A0A0C9S573_9CONI